MIDADDKPIRQADKGLKTIEQGAATQVWCAINHKLDGLGGVYCENVEVAKVVAHEAGFQINEITNQKGVQAYAVDAEAASRLWALSEEMLGRKFDV